MVVAIKVSVVLLVSVATGMVKYNEIKVEAPLAETFKSVGQSTIAQIVSFGARAGLTTVMLILTGWPKARIPPPGWADRCRLDRCGGWRGLR